MKRIQVVLVGCSALVSLKLFDFVAFSLCPDTNFSVDPYYAAPDLLLTTILDNHGAARVLLLLRVGEEILVLLVD